MHDALRNKGEEEETLQEIDLPPPPPQAQAFAHTLSPPFEEEVGGDSEGVGAEGMRKRERL